MAWMVKDGDILVKNGRIAIDPSCCCGVCNCPNAPGTLWVHLRTIQPQVCAWTSFQLTRVSPTEGCAVRYYGEGFMDCWTDAFTPCGRLAPVCVTLCQNMTCEVSLGCAASGSCGDDVTSSFSFDSCDPLESCDDPVLFNFLTCAPCGNGTQLCINTSSSPPPP